ncbi:hypothetical protein Golax_010428 [Gossypium laxum]|uniref:Galactinol--sucrose galactosyltransferase n=1 Tax=Gossypium laxum TaxID=34288 RepID=A0A7J8ZHV8_9ROSI|nr:hypothetical protein [Gossypium laxum]
MRLLDGQVATSITLAGANFLANAHPFLTQVPCNIVATPSTFSLDNTNSNTVNDYFVGFKLWWSTHWVGSSGKEMKYETQFMLLDKFNLGRPYVILLPLVEGYFSTSLQPGVGDNVDICDEAMKVARLHLGSFRLMDEKRPPGVWDGVKALQESGCPLGMLIIDDGWQSICINNDPIEKEGIDRATVGLVPPELAHQMYEGHHSHLKSVGIDDVKIDVIEVLELLSEDYDGLVELAKAYYKAHTVSLRKHFNGNAAISSMQQTSDFFFLGTETIALGRVGMSSKYISTYKPMQSTSFLLFGDIRNFKSGGDDFWHSDPYEDPTMAFWLQGCHMMHCAYNSLWMGNFILPDRDMFQSYHQCAELHTASRAISGRPIYVSDSVGKYNFNLLRKVALPDGSILICQHYTLNTRDCLFEDPLLDGKIALKVWNLNKEEGGALAHEKSKASLSLQSWWIALQSKKLKLMKWSQKIKVTLEPLKFELLIVSPVKILPQKQIQITPIGLVNILNSGGAIQLLAFDVDKNVVIIGVKWRGELKVFPSEKPWGCRIDGRRAEFGYDEQMVTTEIPWVNSPMPSTVEYFF